MWVILAADDHKENIRIANFSSVEKARDYISNARNHDPYDNCIFDSNTLLKGCVHAKVVFEKEIPIDP